VLPEFDMLDVHRLWQLVIAGNNFLQFAMKESGQICIRNIVDKV